MNLTVSTNPSCIKDLESTYFNSNIPEIKVGDTVKIGVSITEGNKERVQFAQGVVIAKSNAGLNTTITVRRVLQGIGTERVYLVHSPKLKSIEIIRSSKIRRAKLYYLRDRSGKATRLKQSFK
jgi:large subunit ribosomal protein L19|tara:strand:- start:337 stop:705 length:369 start_codon:yes stop_codon:yes gene_type:complete